MSTNSALLNKFDCLKYLQEVEYYLKKDQVFIEKAVNVFCDIGNLIDRIECCYILTWRDLSKLYQQTVCLLSHAQMFTGSCETKHAIMPKYIKLFEQAHMATYSYIKDTLWQEDNVNELLKLGFPR
jgi:hypothetical protein